MASDVTVEEVTAALKDVYDPEIPVNVVDLGLIYGVTVDDDNHVHVDMTLTAAGCSMGPFIAQQAEWAIADVDGVKDVEVEITFDPPWSADNITEDGRKLLGLDD
ncbi:MAG: iron-sulfur cluster assembly protein [Dehalococcoidia bacterium]